MGLNLPHCSLGRASVTAVGPPRLQACADTQLHSGPAGLPAGPLHTVGLVQSACAFPGMSGSCTILAVGLELAFKDPGTSRSSQACLL